MVGFLSPIATILLSFASIPESPSELTNTKPSPLNDADNLRYGKFLNWFNDTFPTSYTSPSICIAPSNQGGQGIFAIEEIPENELILRIPRTACITTSVALEDADCGKTFAELVKKAGPGSETVALAGFIAKEYLLHKEGKDTKFGPFFDILPWERGFNGQEHVLFWSDDDVTEYLKDTLCWTETNELREEVQLATNILNGIVGPSILEVRRDKNKDENDSSMDSDDEFSLPFLNWIKPKKIAVTSPVDGLKEAVTGAFVIVLTRSFEDDNNSEVQSADTNPGNERLVPMLDIFNHDNNPSITHSTDSQGSVEVRARRTLTAGEELFNQYKEEEEMIMPNHRFFTRFGFVPGITESIYDLLKEGKNDIFIPKRKEV